MHTSVVAATLTYNRFARGPAVQKAMADTPATLLCGTNLTGYPEVTVEWRDNNGTTLTNETNGFTLMHGPEIALIIDPARLEDSGRWVCVLKNTEGSKEVEINLQVGGTSRLLYYCLITCTSDNFIIFQFRQILAEEIKQLLQCFLQVQRF